MIYMSLPKSANAILEHTYNMALASRTKCDNKQFQDFSMHFCLFNYWSYKYENSLFVFF